MTVECSDFTKMDGWIVKALLKKLPEKQKKAVIFKFWHNLTIEEISKTLGITWGETNLLIENALVKLKKSLELEPAFSKFDGLSGPNEFEAA